MDIAVFGLGYVGVVSAACLAEAGHCVVGVDINDAKVDGVNRGESPIVEPEVAALLSRAVADGRLRATSDARDAIRRTEMAWVCVSTPSRPNGSLDRGFLVKVSEEIGEALAERTTRYTVVIRSTALPGTTRDLIVPTLERASGKRAAHDFGVCYHPEFLREGSSVADFRNPPKIVIGSTDSQTEQAVGAIYAGMDAPLINCPLEIAELVKYADNAWHAVKVTFANEIGTISKRVGVDGRTVMDIFCRDRKLNLSEKYLRPGFAFGGSCLPKDLRALAYEGRRLDLELPLLGAVLSSNQKHIERALDMIVQHGSRRVAVLGLTFKPGTDDLRESPLVDLAERLIGKGFDLRIFDPHLNLSFLIGSNRRYIEARIPHIAQLLVERGEDAVDRGGTVVLGYHDPSFTPVLSRLAADQAVIDLAGLDPDVPRTGAYDGICW